MDLVSIIMPCYNMEKYIENSVRTVFYQTYENWELIIIDDASSDSSKEIIQNLEQKDPRVHPIYLDQNGGISNARNAGLKKATGRYIAFLDSDDFWLPEKLEMQISYMKRTDSAFSYTAFDRITSDGEYINTQSVPESLTYKQLLKRNRIGCLTVVIDRQTFGDFTMPTMKHEDYATWLNLLRNSEKPARGLNIPLSRYNLRQGSVSSNKLKSMGWVYKIYRHQEHFSIIKSFLYLLLWKLN